MLVISRKEGESVLIGNDVEIVVVGTGSRVKIGIRAPLDLKVVRTELLTPEEYRKRTGRDANSFGLPNESIPIRDYIFQSKPMTPEIDTANEEEE